MGWGEAAIVGVGVLVGVGVGADVGVRVGAEAGVGETDALTSGVAASVALAVGSDSPEPQAVTAATANTISAVTQLPTQGFTIRPLPLITHS